MTFLELLPLIIELYLYKKKKKNGGNFEDNFSATIVAVSGRLKTDMAARELPPANLVHRKPQFVVYSKMAKPRS